MKIEFKTKGSLLIAQSIEEFSREKNQEGYIPSSNIELKKEGLYINKHAPVYNTKDLAGGIQCIKVTNNGEYLELDVSEIFHSMEYSNKILNNDYSGPIEVEIELWTKESCVSRYSFELLTSHLAVLIQDSNSLKNGEKEKIQVEINSLKSAWVNSYKKKLATISIIDAMMNYFEIQERSITQDEEMMDLFFEFKEETKIIILLIREHLQQNLKSEFTYLDESSKKELQKILEENEGYEFYPFIGYK